MSVIFSSLQLPNRQPRATCPLVGHGQWLALYAPMARDSQAPITQSVNNHSVKRSCAYSRIRECLGSTADSKPTGLFGLSKGSFGLCLSKTFANSH